MSFTKADFSEVLFEGIGLNKSEAKEMIELFFETIKRSLETGEQVKILRFGKFELRDKKSRPGRNPKTCEKIPIAARRVVTFRAAKKLKAGVEQYAETQQ